jgi:hypothetical protein
MGDSYKTKWKIERFNPYKKEYEVPIKKGRILKLNLGKFIFFMKFD